MSLGDEVGSSMELKWHDIKIHALAFGAKADFMKITKYDSALFPVYNVAFNQAEFGGV